MIQGKKIRVMVVDDSMLARSLIINGLSAHPQIEVVGFAINALDAKTKYPKLKPDVMTMDVEMPGMTGIEFLRQFLPQNPVPVVLCSSLDLKVFDALAAGAVDFVRKPDPGKQEAFVNALTRKVLAAANARPRVSAANLVTPAANKPAGFPSISHLAQQANGPDTVLIGLGASTGGTEATLEVMKRLPADIPGMVIVQHMPPGFTKMYADRLNRLCSMEVREAKDGDILQRGLALVAPADLQTTVVRSGTHYAVKCAYGEKVSGHRPSVDMLFRSMADTVKCRMVGIILTGMGRDGADGLLRMRKKGAYTIGQDQESSVVYGMPGVAQEIGAVITQAPCDRVATVLLNHLKTLN